jgi:hypothetical protein
VTCRRDACASIARYCWKVKAHFDACDVRDVCLGPRMRVGSVQAIWIYTCFIHRFSMERIKDYFMMYLHHLLTIGLIGAHSSR